MFGGGEQEEKRYFCNDTENAQKLFYRTDTNDTKAMGLRVNGLACDWELVITGFHLSTWLCYKCAIIMSVLCQLQFTNDTVTKQVLLILAMTSSYTK